MTRWLRETIYDCILMSIGDVYYTSFHSVAIQTNPQREQGLVWIAEPDQQIPIVSDH